MHRGLIWLAIIDLRRAGLRSGLTALAIGIAVLAICVVARQSELQRSAMLESYEQGGATTFIAEIRDVSAAELDPLITAIRLQKGVRGADAPYRGTDFGVIADTSFLVFENDKQQEYLGATTAVLGVTGAFDLLEDYHEEIGSGAADSPKTLLGIPLLVANGVARDPAPDEILIPAVVADYVGVRPGATANVEFIHNTISGTPITRRYAGLQVIATFDILGPDEGRFAPFWRFAARGRDVLTVRRSDTPGEMKTTLPMVVSGELFRDFVDHVSYELQARTSERFPLPGRHQIVVHTNAILSIPEVEDAVGRIFGESGLENDCVHSKPKSFCLRLPHRNNFRTALREQEKFEAGTSFFGMLLLGLVITAMTGLQGHTVISRWHEHALLQALGFAPSQLPRYLLLRLALLLGLGVAGAGVMALALPPSWMGSLQSFATAAILIVVSCLIAALPIMLWPLRRPPGDQLRNLA